MNFELKDLTPKILSNDGWIDLEDNKRLRVDYPTRSQGTFLKGILADGTINGKLKYASRMEYIQYYLKFTIKDWEGQKEKCVLIDNELEDELWESIIKEDKQTIGLYNEIEKTLEWLDTDKKK